MHPTFSFISVLTFLAITSLGAQDGEQLYAQYCSACHGADGKGATGGAFPPLAGSPWVHGNPKRAAAIILNGLHGPIDVNGKSYNLEMPPQGAVLGDDQITSILNFVNSSWGNKGEKVQRDLVRVTRSEYQSRNAPWTAPELLKLYPLPIQKTALSDLTSKVYKGQWDQIPDFDKIQAENIEEEHHGLLKVSIAGMKDHFGIVWEGKFHAPDEGEYVFVIDADDGARLTINGQVIAIMKHIGAMNGSRAVTGKIKLTKGAHPIRVDYFESVGQEGISLRWQKTGDKDWNWLSDKSPPAKGEAPSIPLIPTDGKTVIYRNFIAGTTPRAIGFGFPGGLNLVYSADNLAPELLWSGDFMDAGRHWTNRGQGNQPPSGSNIIKLSDKRFLPAEARFKGYSLDSKGNPSFKVSMSKATLTDSWKSDDKGSLIRTLTLDGGSEILIPHGNPEITGAESTTLTPGKPVTLTYKLK
ncbi:MAG: hypothetical protein RL346_587 [Verrucomicrobiota bacterium]|jgi:mono/diheme cytochrome c family protein